MFEYSMEGPLISQSAHALILAPSLEKLTHLNPVMFLSRPIGRVFRLPFLSVFEYIVHSRNFSSVGLPELDTSP